MTFPEAVSERVANRDLTVLFLSDGQGQPMHSHPWDHDIFLVRGRILIAWPDGGCALDAPAVWNAKADQPHSVTAVGPAIVINIREVPPRKST